MHFVATLTVEKLEEHHQKVKKHSISLIRRTIETIGKDVALLLWEPQNNKSKELK